MKELKVGLIAALTGRSAKMGSGVADSAKFILRRRETDLFSSGVKVQLIVCDDKGDPFISIDRARELESLGVVCLIGPCDSACAYELLASGVCYGVPTLTPLATATVLTGLGVKNFFRVTTPDNLRAQMLVTVIGRYFPRKCVQVYCIADSTFSYAQQLRLDVTASLEQQRHSWRLEEVGSSELPSRFPEEGQPVILCGVSEEVARMTSTLRRKGLRFPAFAFGSNSNFLIPDLEGMIVVADLDRDDTNALVREEIEKFESSRTSSGDPSLATMNCATLLVNLLVEKNVIATMDIDPARAALAESLRNSQLRGLIGPIAFTSSGELIGSEHLSILKVSNHRGRMCFRKLEAWNEENDEERSHTKGKIDNEIKIFVSHSSKDKPLSEALVRLLRSALSLPSEAVRCTSVDGSRLEAGVPSEGTLRDQLLASPVFLLLATKNSLESTFVLFEAGARWGACQEIIVLLGPRVEPSQLRSPISSFNALKCSEAAQLHQLIDDVARKLARSSPRAASYQKELEELLAIANIG